MAGIFTKYGLDLDAVYMRGTGNQAFQIYDNSGMDIGQKFIAGSSELETGIRTSNGQDICRRLGGMDYGIYRINGYPWNAHLVGGNWDINSHASYWENWLKNWKYEGGNISKNVSNITNEAYIRACDSDYGYSVLVWAYSPFQSNPIEFTCTNNIYWHSHSYSFEAKLIDAGSFCKGYVLQPLAGAGGGVKSFLTFQLRQGGQRDIRYEGCFGYMNDDNNPATSNSAWSENYNGKSYVFHL
ncbi:hypothetical protein [uncultured Sutterella sp.]|uniref:hypothetical protein n=1 Tax=uncultured Sutterella sp. TaxID=286133 RepID=UPI0026706264|nr:hypothetical protein [uncultured Sutterella sp.]